ncbi:hypothetical protein MMC25_006171 [Agyrium rufum]|nr:hypothetical protein [Agyrium rufum]
MTRSALHKSAATSTTSLLRQAPLTRSRVAVSPALRTTFFTPCRYLAQVQSGHDIYTEVWFAGSGSRAQPSEGGFGQRPDQPPDERTVKLGKTLRILQARLPTLLASPLPNEILSPHITLHLFPTTHPHLPSVSGRVAYHAALWTAPVTWGKVPFLDVKLIILNERMIKNGGSSVSSNLHTSPHFPSPSSSQTPQIPRSTMSEKLIVRWKTQGKTKGKGVGALYRGIGAREQVDKITEWLGGELTKDDEDEFTGLFIFEFDEEGRIISHTIEHAEEGGNWDKASRVVTVTDWLLGKARGRRECVPEEEGGLAWQCGEWEGGGEVVGTGKWMRRAQARLRS